MRIQPWEEYARANLTEEPSEILQLLLNSCLTAENALNQYSENYNFKGKQPRIYIDSRSDSSCLCKSDGSVVITEGYVSYIYSLMRAQSALLNTPKPEVNSIEVISILWAISHEYFHFARGHFKIGQPKYQDAFEFDADHMATVSVFRYLSHAINTSGVELPEHSYEVKQFIFEAIFLVLREKLEDTNQEILEDRDCHMPIPARILAVIQKLAAINTTNPDSTLSDKSRSEYEALFMHMRMLEQKYIKAKKIPSVLSSYSVPKMNEVIDAVARKWSEISPFVLQNQFIECDAGLLPH